jgi:hypothetical protein
MRFSLLNMAQRNLRVQLYQFFSEESQENADFENLHFMSVLFKHVQYWLTKEIYRYLIKKSKYVYSLPQRLSTYLDLNFHRYSKKKTCAENFSSSMVYLI